MENVLKFRLCNHNKIKHMNGLKLPNFLTKGLGSCGDQWVQSAIISEYTIHKFQLNA